MTIANIEALNELVGDWSDIKAIIPYGYGLDAKRTLKRIINDFTVPFIVDSDEAKWGQKFMDVEISSPEKLKNFQKGEKVLVTIARRRYDEIKKILDAYGLVENQDYCHISQFATEWYYRYKHEYSIFTLDMALTTACTLRCQHCNMFVPHYKKPVMYGFDSIKNSLDLLMNRIDYIFTIGLLGGEALLNPELEKILRYMHMLYGNKIGQILITTNGVAIPSKAVIKMLKEQGVMITISDYSHAVGEQSHVHVLAQQLEHEGIPYNIRRDLVWCAFGFPENPWSLSDDKARDHMLGCNPGWRGLNDGKFYFCNVAWSADKAGLFQLRKDDYIDLAQLPAQAESSKRKIIEYSFGEMPHGYMSFCKVCGGCGADNMNFVQAGEQVDSK